MAERATMIIQSSPPQLQVTLYEYVASEGLMTISVPPFSPHTATVHTSSFSILRQAYGL